jgi:hypothetical protein
MLHLARASLCVPLCAHQYSLHPAAQREAWLTWLLQRKHVRRVRRYGVLILLVEMMGFTAMLPYVLLCVHGHYPRNPGSLGLPAAGRSPEGPEYRSAAKAIALLRRCAK